MLCNRDWENLLRRSDDFSNCRFPNEDEIGVEGSQDLVTLTIRTKGLYENMQGDAAAFEAWSLALLCHCGVKRVAIRLDEEPGDREGLLHFERLLYRLARFAELFPEEISIDSSVATRSKVVSSKGRLFLNEPGDRSALIDSELATRFEAIIANPASHSERDLEMALEISPAFRAELGLDRVMRQWPVGLFHESVSRDSRVFSGGKSAIDLMGIRGRTLVLVELKKQGNNKVGALSELIFYSSVMRDALNGRFEFEGGSRERNTAITRDHLANCLDISAVLLAPSIHPLLRHPGIITRLNLAAARRWEDRPVRFEVFRIASIPGKAGDDFGLSRVRPAEDGAVV
ncbi:hypothetical protein IVB08_22040 [Bradyrhizobium sp. 173]|uniref:hypothetical protein n=1 Tax=Bradyrhizobium sp. 173 TaxID=2782644 RepID=UPI001FF8373D|nr:hypothetical protein [Bradyrhizobium sp. 173]MCK1566610.1 hypothetical protein [Bradyrhizobium sp. 173]